jgi:hypothetical protein
MLPSQLLSLPSQISAPVGWQMVLQVPLTQVAASPQSKPQAPQLSLSVRKSVHGPLL